MSDYSQVNETSYYFTNSIVTPNVGSRINSGYSNMVSSYSIPQSFQNSAYYKFKYVNGADRSMNGDRPNPTKQPKEFKPAIPNKSERQDLKITEGSQGLKFARIARAIDQIQSDLKCPYTQYFDGTKCIDYPKDTQVCPAEQYYETLLNKCIPVDPELAYKSVEDNIKGTYLQEILKNVTKVEYSLRSMNPFRCLPVESFDTQNSSCVDECPITSTLGLTIGENMICIPSNLKQNGEYTLLLYNPDNSCSIYVKLDDENTSIKYNILAGNNIPLFENTKDVILYIKDNKPVLNYSSDELNLNEYFPRYNYNKFYFNYDLLPALIFYFDYIKSKVAEVVPSPSPTVTQKVETTIMSPVLVNTPIITQNPYENSNYTKTLRTVDCTKEQPPHVLGYNIINKISDEMCTAAYYTPNPPLSQTNNIQYKSFIYGCEKGSEFVKNSFNATSDFIMKDYGDGNCLIAYTDDPLYNQNPSRTESEMIGLLRTEPYTY